MIEITGQLVNTFTVDAGTNKKGEAYDAKDKIQLLGELEQPNGEKRMEMLTLTVDDLSAYVAWVGQRIRVPVGAMGTSGRGVLFFVRKGTKPQAA